MDTNVNAWQEAIHDVVFVNQRVEPKRVAARLHRHSDFLSDICRRDRVDPFAAANAILLELEHRYASHDMHTLARESHRFFQLLYFGTRWYAAWSPPMEAAHPENTADMRDKIGSLMQDLGGAVESLCAICADRKINEADDSSITEFDSKSNRLIRMLQQLSGELHRRRLNHDRPEAVA